MIWMRSTLMAISVALILLLSAIAMGESKSPCRRLSLDPKHRQEVLGAQHYTVMGLTLDDSTLKDVMAKFGDATLLPSRTEHDSKRICYKSDQDGTILVFSAGPLGAWRVITGFSILADDYEFSERDLCASSALISSSIQTEGNIGLIVSHEQVKSILGHPSEEAPGKLYYSFICELPMSDADIERMDAEKYPFYNVSSSITAVFRDEKMVALTVIKTESY